MAKAQLTTYSPSVIDPHTKYFLIHTLSITWIFQLACLKLTDNLITEYPNVIIKFVQYFFNMILIFFNQHFLFLIFYHFN